MKATRDAFRTKHCKAKAKWQEEDRPFDKPDDQRRSGFANALVPFRRPNFGFERVPESVHESENGKGPQCTVPQANDLEVDEHWKPQAEQVSRNGRKPVEHAVARSRDR